MPDITLLTRDGARLAFTCGHQDYILDAAESAGLFLPAMCHEGTCGACHAHVAEGPYTLGPVGEGVLPDAENGGVLLCRCRPNGDLHVNVLYADTEIHRQRVLPREATITCLAPAGSGAMAMTLALAPSPELGTAADFLPGQYMEVAIPGTSIRRAYSMANLPNWEGRLEFLIRLKPGGAFSTWLAEHAQPGHTLAVRGPFGHFLLDEASPRSRCLIGGGCGFAPILSMLRHLADFQDMQPTTLIFAANDEDELFAADAIDELRANLPMLSVMRSVWRPRAAWEGFVGTAADAFASVLDQEAEQPDVYVCGPPKLLESVLAVAAAHGIPRTRIFTEQQQLS